MSTGKIFENVNAKRLFVSLYEELSEEKKTAFGQEIREMFDEKITDMARIEGFYLNESDVRKCYDKALEEKPKTIEKKMTTFKEDDEEGFAKPSESTDEQLPKGW